MWCGYFKLVPGDVWQDTKWIRIVQLHWTKKRSKIWSKLTIFIVFLTLFNPSKVNIQNPLLAVPSLLLVSRPPCLFSTAQKSIPKSSTHDATKWCFLLQIKWMRRQLRIFWTTYHQQLACQKVSCVNYLYMFPKLNSVSFFVQIFTVFLDAVPYL